MRKNVERKKTDALICGLAVLFVLQLFFAPLSTKVYAEAANEQYVIVTEDEESAELIKNEFGAIKKGNNVLTGTLAIDKAETLKSDENIISVEKDFIIEDDDLEEFDVVKPINKDWNRKAINAEVGADLGTMVKIAILDSGIDWTDNVVVKERKNFIPGESDETPLFDDLHGHGTGVASIIASKGLNSDVRGVNNNVELYSARVLDENLQAPVSRVVEAIYWAIEKDVDIINISFGTEKYSEALKSAIEAATDKDILIVAAAGNNGNEVVNYPAAFEEVLSVGAINAAGEISGFSSRGPKVDVYAPGEAVSAHGNFGEDLVLSGTSLAAPHVTGVAALLLGEDSTRTSDYIKKLIIASSKKLNSHNVNNGILDYGYALELSRNNNVQTCFSEPSIIREFKQNNEISSNANAFEDLSDPVVEGSWTSDIHGMHYANQDMKAGALVSDKSDYLALMKTNPEFHGYSWHGSPSKPSFSTGTCNYFANYKYLVLVALKGDGDHTKVASVQGLSSTCRNRMEKGITNIKKTAAYENASNKKAFLMGIAMHTAADTFAHSSFKPSGGSWVIIQHPDADDVMKINNRVNMAYHVMRNVVDRQNGNRSGINYCHDFHDEQTTAYYTNVTFKINKMKSFAEAAGVTNSTILGHFGKIS